MKKKSASRSAFFNIRVLIGLFILLAGVFLALIGLGTFSGLTASSAQAKQKHQIIDIPGLPPGFDCATIYEKGFHKMESLRAGLIMIACGEAEGGGSGSSGSAFSRLIQKLEAPLAYGAADVDLITGADTPPHIIQSETYSTANPDNPDQTSPSTIREAPQAAISPVYRAPPTAAPPSPASPNPPVKAHSPTHLATQLFCSTSPAKPG